MFRKATAAIILLLLPALAHPAQAIDFQVGQVWSYHSRPGEQESELYITRIDRDLGSRPIFHLYIDGLKLKNPLIEGGIQDHLLELPISQEALEASVVKMVQANSSLPNVSEGYDLWRRAFDSGQAGVFTMPVSQAIQYIEDDFAKHKRQ